MLAYSAVNGAPASAKTDAKILKYLSTRGISLELAIKLQVKVLPAKELFSAARAVPNAWDALEDARLAIVFPHFSIRGELMDWWSARLVQGMRQPLPKSNVHSFGSYVDPSAPGAKKLQKMTCPPGEPPQAYLPQAAGLPDWQNIPRGSRIYIHESIIKAVNGAVLGKYSVGLNGVWGWGSKAHEQALVSGIKDIPWKELDLTPVILFDTDIDSNQQVGYAASKLASRLSAIYGRTAKLLKMTKEADEEDFGFDDYVARHGPEVAKQFLESLDEDLEDVDVSELELKKGAMSEEYCVIKGLGKVGRIHDGKVYSFDNFAAVTCADITVMLDTAAGTPKEHNVARMWIKDARRTVVEDLTYAPGQPKLCTVRGQRYLNRWPGWGCEPAEGDIRPWIELMHNNVKHMHMVEWLLDWFAYPLQNPGAKLASYPLIFGPQGLGKDRLLAPIRLIYGANLVKIGSKALASGFNSVYAEKQFIHADEIKSHHFTADDISQIVKGIVTDVDITVNRKNQEEYVIPATANLLVSSNYIENIKLDEDDRRAGVINWNWELAGGVKRNEDKEYWNAYDNWVNPTKSNEGGPAVFYSLLNRDLSKFDPNGWAPLTAEKREVIEAGRTGMSAFVYGLKYDAAMMLGSGTDRQLYTIKDLLTLYFDGREYTGSAQSAMTKELKNAGFRQANGGNPLRWNNGRQDRMWIIPRYGSPELDFQVSSVCLNHLKSFGAKL